MEIHCIHSFAKDAQGGNPAGVAIVTDPLSEEVMLAAAKAVGYSETVFCHQRADGYHFRYFTPTDEVDLCGHATIAALHLLQAEATPVIHTKAGLIKTHLEEDRYFMTQTAPTFGGPIAKETIADLLGIETAHITHEPQILSTGLHDIIVLLDSESVLNSLKPDMAALAAYNETTNTVGMHVATLETKDPKATAQARNFAPRYGIPEESATGTSTAALTYYLQQHNLLPEHSTFCFEQGYAMGLPSELLVKLVGDELYIGGRCYTEKVTTH